MKAEYEGLANKGFMIVFNVLNWGGDPPIDKQKKCDTMVDVM